MYMIKNELATKPNFILQNLQNHVTDAALEIQKNIGLGFSTHDYCRAFAYELKLRRIPFESHKEVELPYKGEIAGKYQLDFVVDSQLILTVLSADEILSSDLSKLRHFLRSMNLKLGVMINFASDRVEIKAVHR